MNAKIQISLARKTLYGIMLIAVLFAAFGGGNLSFAQAQKITSEKSLISLSAPTQLSNMVQYSDPRFTIEIPNSWFVSPSFSQGVLPNMKGTAFSSYPLQADIPGSYNSSEAMFIVSLEAINIPSDLNLFDFVNQNYGLDYMRIIRTENLPNKVEVVETLHEQGQIYYLKYKETVFGLIFPWSNLHQDKETLLQTINSLLLVDGNSKISTNGLTEIISSSTTEYEDINKKIRARKNPPLSAPSMLFPWDSSITNIRYTGGPQGSPWVVCGQNSWSGYEGIDFGMYQQEVLAVAAGTVSFGYDSVVGNYVIVDHGGWTTHYWHMGSIDSSLSNGTSVSQGRVLGISGNTGSGANGAYHLHLSLRQNGVSYSWNGTDINGWKVRSDLVPSDQSKGYNYQGTMTKGNESFTTISECGGQALEYHGSTATAYASVGGSGTILISSNQRNTGVSSCSTLNPNSDQIALFIDANYGGSTCKLLGIGEYSNPASMGFPNDALSSIKVGSNVKATLCAHDNYGTPCEDFTSSDPNLSDNSVGNESVSSIKVASNSGGGGPSGYTWCADEDGTCSFNGVADVAYGANGQFYYHYQVNYSTGCNNNVFGDPINGTSKACYYKMVATADQSIQLYKAWHYEQGYCYGSSAGNYTNLDGCAGYDETISSILLKPGWSVRLFKNRDLGGTSKCFTSNDDDFANDTFDDGTSLNDQVSSFSLYNQSSCPSLIPIPPTLSSPGNGSSNPYNYVLNFQWNSSSGATGYTVEWWGGPYSTMQPCVNTSSTSCYVGTIVPGNTYYWHVKALNSSGATSNWSDTWSFTIQPAPPGSFNKSSPANGVTGQSTSPTLTWGNSSGVTSYEYCYDTTNDSFCSNWASNGNSTSKTLNGLSAITTYYWHVRAVNSGGTTYANGSATAFWSFTTQGNPPGAFNKTAPPNNSTGQSTSPNLTWGASSGATSYDYCYDTTNDNACSSWTSNGNNTSKTLIGLSAGTKYYWHVRAVNSSGTTYANSGTAAFWSFTTQSTPQPPGAFNKTAPSNNSTGQSTSPSLAWGASSGATSYDYCYDTTNDNSCSGWTSNGNNTSKTLTGLSAGTKYYWHVRAVNTSGTTYANGGTAAFWSFTTQGGNLPPGTFYKSSPPNSSTGQSTSPTLEWGASSLAASYEYCIDTSNDNACSNWISNGTNLSKTLSGLSAATTYYWQVRAKNSAGTTYANGNETAFWSFTAQLSSSGFNLLMNSGFEDGNNLPAWWQKDAWMMDYSIFTWDTLRKYSELRSVKITNTLGNDARWIQRVYVQPNSNYRLSGWISTDNVPQNQGDRGANLSILGGFIGTNNVSGTSNWTQVFIDFNTGSATYVDVAARLGAYSGLITGTAWFDDLKLELLSTPICYNLSTTSNPSFGGSISENPAPNCNGTQYIHGTVVQLTAIPSAGYHFTSWQGDASGTTNPVTITMTGNKSVTALFSDSSTITATFKSTATYDGWVIESSETSKKGGWLNVAATTFFVGDDADNRQLRGFLSFATDGLPDNAVITKITLKIRKQGLVGTNPFTTHNGLKVDIRKGRFGSSINLQALDFQALASKNAVGTFIKTPTNNWYSANLSSIAFPYVNLSGVTQFRLRFAKDDNNDNGADYLKFFSGNAALWARPQLIIEYNVP